jgi:Protein of unknown function (DUF3071)
MRALRVVGLTEDGEVVLEDPVRLERFRVPADERLRAAARGDLSRLGQIAIELESQLRPREIQARIRAGASVEQVAAAAGVPEQKIERFAYPVLLERFRTAEIAQRAHPVRAEGPDNRTLAEVVGHTFGLRGQAYEGARWDSWKGEDGRWVVALGWRAGRSDNRAHWTFQPGAHGGTVTALDEHASDLVEGLPARPLRTVGAVVDMNRPEEEPPPAPSPVEQWRAAASDSYRERMPVAPEPARPAADRGPTRPAESWRPVVPTQRQGEREAAEPRENGNRPAAERAPAERGAGTERSAPAGEQTRPESTQVAITATAAAPTVSSAPAAMSTAPLPGPTAAPTVPAAHVPAPPATTAAASVLPGAPAGPASAAPDTAPDTAAAASSAVPGGTGAPSADRAAQPAKPDRAADAPAESTTPTEPTDDVPAPSAETPASGDAPATRRTRKGKPVMPSWDEVLLGVRGPR